jgi:hypothetical protein
LNLSIRTTASGEIEAGRAIEDGKVNPTKSAMISSTRSTISSIVVLFSSINYDIVSARSVRIMSVTTYTQILESRPCRPDHCLSGWYDHECLLSDSQS